MAKDETIIKETVGDQPEIIYKESKRKEKTAKLPDDKSFTITTSKDLRIGGHEFKKGEKIASIRCRFGLLPRVIFEHLGRLYSLDEDKK